MRILLDVERCLKMHLGLLGYGAEGRRFDEGDPAPGVQRENSMKVAGPDPGAGYRRGGDNRSTTSCWRLPGSATITTSGKPISSLYTQKAIDTGEVVYADGNEVPAPLRFIRTASWDRRWLSRCAAKISGSSVPIKLCEAKNRLFGSINRTLGGGNLRSCCRRRSWPDSMSGKGAADAVGKSLHAQVNPHFLFNALNTPKAVIRRDSDQPGSWCSTCRPFSAKNLKRPAEIVTLADEIEHVNAYLQIEKAFSDQFADSYAGARGAGAASAGVYPAANRRKRD